MLKIQPILWPYSIEVPDLKLHELDFEARIVGISESVDVSLSTLNELQNEMSCPICLDILKNVMVTKCLHRYCRECIETHLCQLDQARKCPLCCKDINKRGLKQDLNMDLLVSLFFPKNPTTRNCDLGEHKVVFNEGARRHKEQVQRMKQQSKLKKSQSAENEKRKREEIETETDTDDADVTSHRLQHTDDYSNRITQQTKQNSHSKVLKRQKSHIEFVICKHPGERILPDISNGMVTTGYGDSSATILDVKHFVLQQLSSIQNNFDVHDFELIITYPGDTEDEGDIPPSSVTISNYSITIAQMAPIFHEKAIMIVLLYRLTPNGIRKTL
jgi:hypothetical protein